VLLKSADLVGGSVSMPSDRYSGFADSQSIYNAAIKITTSAKFIADTNQHDWGGGISIKNTNLKFFFLR
jgi:hypothetical protein